LVVKFTWANVGFLNDLGVEFGVMKRDVALGTNQRVQFLVKRVVCFFHIIVKVFDYVVLDFRPCKLNKQSK